MRELKGPVAAMPAHWAPNGLPSIRGAISRGASEAAPSSPFTDHESRAPSAGRLQRRVRALRPRAPRVPTNSSRQGSPATRCNPPVRSTALWMGLARWAGRLIYIGDDRVDGFGESSGGQAVS